MRSGRDERVGVGPAVRGGGVSPDVRAAGDTGEGGDQPPGSGAAERGAEAAGFGGQRGVELKKRIEPPRTPRFAKEIQGQLNHGDTTGTTDYRMPNPCFLILLCAFAPLREI